MEISQLDALWLPLLRHHGGVWRTSILRFFGFFCLLLLMAAIFDTTAHLTLNSILSSTFDTGYWSRRCNDRASLFLVGPEFSKFLGSIETACDVIESFLFSNCFFFSFSDLITFCILVVGRLKDGFVKLLFKFIIILSLKVVLVILIILHARGLGKDIFLEICVFNPFP